MTLVVHQGQAAHSTDLDLNITHLECTLDETYSSSQPQYSLNPSECEQLPVNASIAPGVAKSNDPALSGDQVASGDEGREVEGSTVLANSVFKELAQILGIDVTTHHGDGQTYVTIGLFVLACTLLTTYLLLHHHKPGKES